MIYMQLVSQKYLGIVEVEKTVVSVFISLQFSNTFFFKKGFMLQSYII